MVFQKKQINVEEKEEVVIPVNNKKQNEGDCELVEVPTQTTIAFKLGEEVFDDRAMLLKIYNDLQDVKKAVM